ncbi:MAG: glycosyltransferase family 39 protein [Bacteroidia bacterium]
MNYSGKRISLFALLIIMAGIIIGHTTLPRKKHHFYTEELTFDVTSYYLYLPMTFIYNDIGMKNHAITDSIFNKYHPSPTFYQAFDYENGNKVMNYTCGFAYAYSPFFFIADFWAKHSAYPRDGFSFPYQFSIGIGVLLYILGGWIFVRKILLNYFSDHVAALVMIFVAFGTNYFSEAINNYLQPHAMLFSAYALFIYCIIRWHQVQLKKYLIVGGLMMGWMVLSRPSEILCVLIPLLWNVYDKDSLTRKWKLVSGNFGQILLLIICAFVVFIPQFIYWKAVTGHAIFFSYQHTEGFDFAHPHFLQVLFSFKKSLLVYTPILVFPLAGMFILYRRKKEIFFAVLAYGLMNFMLLGCWAAWWNGGSFGMRYWAQSYAMMTIPFGFAIQAISERKLFAKIFFGSVLSFFVFLNVFQTWQFLNWIIPDDRMTFEYYKRIFLKTKVSDEDKKLMEIERSFASEEKFENDNEYVHYTKAYYNFSDINATPIDQKYIDTTVYHSPPSSLRVSNENMYYPTYEVKYSDLVKWNKDHVWLRVSVYYYSDTDIDSVKSSLIIKMPHGEYTLKGRGFDFEKRPFVKGQWNKIVAEYMTPFPYLTSDKFQIFVMYRGADGKYINIDDMQVEVYEKPD